MEYIIKDTDIFDLDICKKVETLITENNLACDTETWHKLEVIFHVNLINSDKMKEYYLQYVPKNIVDNKKKEDQKDYIYGVLGYVLENIQDVFKKFKINIDDLLIAGDDIKFENIIIIDLSVSKQIKKVEETNKRGRRKKQTHIIARSIMPSRPFINNQMHKLVEKAINERFDNYLDIVGTKVMSQILGIEGTDNINVLFKEFVNQYAYLFTLHRDGEIDELHEKFREKAEFVWEKYYAKEGETVGTNELPGMQ